MATRSFKGPRGTRDMYPEDMLRRRYLLQTWRDTSIRHGFEEIEGPGGRGDRREQEGGGDVSSESAQHRE